MKLSEAYQRYASFFYERCSMYIYYNSNPSNKSVGDCVVRALSVVFGDSWENVYADLTMVGRYLYDMPNSNHVWADYLLMNGFVCDSLWDIRR